MADRSIGRSVSRRLLSSTPPRFVFPLRTVLFWGISSVCLIITTIFNWVLCKMSRIRLSIHFLEEIILELNNRNLCFIYVATIDTSMKILNSLLFYFFPIVRDRKCLFWTERNFSIVVGLQCGYKRLFINNNPHYIWKICIFVYNYVYRYVTFNLVSTRIP